MSATTTWNATINASPEAVFAVLSDVERHAEWSQHPFKATKTSEGTVGVGATYDTFGWLPGKGNEHENKVTITSFEPGKHFAFDSLDASGAAPVTIPSDFALRADGSRTSLTRTMTFPRPPGFQGVLWPVIFPILVKPAIQKNLNELKALVEGASSGSGDAGTATTS